MDKIDLIAKLNDSNDLVWLDQEYFYTFISGFPKDTLFQVTVKKGEHLRSSKYNRYYWGVIINLALSAFKENGYNSITKNEIHNFFKGRFLMKEQVDILTGEIKIIANSTSDLTTKEMNEYIMSIEEFLLEQFGIDLSKILKKKKYD